MIFYLYQELRPNFVQKLNMISGITHVPETAAKPHPKPCFPGPLDRAKWRISEIFFSWQRKKPLDFGNHLNIVHALGCTWLLVCCFSLFGVVAVFFSCGLWLLSSCFFKMHYMSHKPTVIIGAFPHL